MDFSLAVPALRNKVAAEKLITVNGAKLLVDQKADTDAKKAVVDTKKILDDAKTAVVN